MNFEDILAQVPTMDEEQLKALMDEIQKYVAGKPEEAPAEQADEEPKEGDKEAPKEKDPEEEEKLQRSIDAVLEAMEKRGKELKAEKRAALANKVAAGLAGETIKRGDIMEKNETRAKKFMETKKGVISCEEMRSVLVSGGTLATPTGVSGINDLLGNRVSSILDLVKVVNCNGMGSNKVAYLAADPDAAPDQTEGNAVTNKDATFGYVTITPASIGVYTQISKQAKKQSPLQYEAKVNSEALLSLRKAAVGKIVAKLKASTLNQVYNPTLTSGAGKIGADTLRKIVLQYGGDNDVVGDAVLFLNKTDLIAFGDVRGTNEKKAVYEIEPDGSNPNMGTIKDGGMTVRYCLCSGLTALEGTSQSASAAIPTMFYGNPQCFELDLFSDYEVRVSEDFAFTSLMDTIVGDAEIGGDVVVKNGFVAVTIAKS